ncbi:MAG: hypothetical protein ACP5GX_03190 [Anaerolineae bacterium]
MINSDVPVVVLISARAEWRVVREYFPKVGVHPSPYGEWFWVYLEVSGAPLPVIFFHGGWGKIAASGSTQYAIDRWSPRLLVNLGTCGGFEGEIERGAIVLVERTLVYDIIEQMGNPMAALAHYTTDLDLSWLEDPPPQPVVRGLLLSADRDLVAEEVAGLKAEFGAQVADWESGAIAYVAARNGVPCLILRGVTDLVGAGGGEAYDGTVALFARRAREIMSTLLDALPRWLEQVQPDLRHSEP